MKLEKIFYDVKENGICSDICPYIRDKRIGSGGCDICDFNFKNDLKEKYVYCGYKNKIRKEDTPIIIYLAGALFTVAEQKFNEMLKIQIENRINNVQIFLPQKECSSCTTSKEISDKCKEGIDISSVIISVLEGVDVDSGTAWECGYAYSQGKKIIGIRTDFRQRGDDALSGLNCMISQNLYHLIQNDNITEIVDEIESVIESIKVYEVGI